MAVKGKTTANASKADANEEQNDARMALGMRNYKLMLIGFAVIVIGFVLMSGGGSPSPDEFNYDMFSFRRITLSTILVLGGFAFVAYGIMSKGKKSREQ